MAVTYSFKSLAELADYLDKRARQITEEAFGAKSTQSKLLHREAYTYRSIAQLLRDTEIVQ